MGRGGSTGWGSRDGRQGCWTIRDLSTHGQVRRAICATACRRWAAAWAGAMGPLYGQTWRSVGLERAGCKHQPAGSRKQLRRGPGLNTAMQLWLASSIINYVAVFIYYSA